MRRAQDSINPRTHPDIMVLSHDDSEGQEEPHPYWYARIIGIYHADVRYKNRFGRMDFLWVRWLGRDLSYKAGWKARRLPRVGFVPDDTPDSGAFGFLDPAVVIHAVHLIPAFSEGKTAELLKPSIARRESDNDEDWQYFYVNM